MKPRLTSLKFRLPWIGERVLSKETKSVDSEYLMGEIHIIHLPL